MLIIIFGLPGVGKNYVAETLVNHKNFYFYDADDDLTPAMKQAIKEQQVYTTTMRDEYFAKVIAKISKLKQQHPRLVVTQALAKNRHRELIQTSFPQAKFVWVQADENLIAQRLKQRRSDVIVTLEYAKKIKTIFEQPSIKHQIISNNAGKDAVLKQFQSVFAAE